MLKDRPFAYFIVYTLRLCPALTQTSVAEQDCIATYARGKVCVVEIGVWHGVNTRRFREVMNSEGTLYAIDPFESGKFGVSWQEKIARREVSKFQRGTLIWLKNYSYNAVEKFKVIEPRTIDFLFIDGDHSYEGLKKDWELWSPLIALNGFVALHDSRSCEDRVIEHMGSVQYTQEAIVHDPSFKVVETCDSLTVLQKVA